MSTDQSNNNTIEPPNNNPSSVEGMDFFQHVLHHPPPTNIWSNSTDYSTPSPPPTNNIWSNSTDLSNNVSYSNANIYMRFLEDILQMPPLITYLSI